MTETDRVLRRRAFETCLRLARAHYENFPVASRLLPAAMRPHVAAVYAFARVADDFADEGTRSPAERLALLDRWGQRLARIGPARDVQPAGAPRRSRDVQPAGAPRRSRDVQPAGEPRHSRDVAAPDATHPDAEDIFRALAYTVEAHALPVGLLEDLLSAFRQDVTVTRYASWEDLLDYCRRSANPVGRLVLRICGIADGDLDRRADAVCSALQLTNFLQDFGRDWRAGRLYVPADIRLACGARLADLEADRITPAWRAALARCAARTRALFVEGRPVCDAVAGRLRMELRLTWLGGMRILERVGRAEYDPLHDRPTLRLADAVPLVWRAVVWT